MFRSGKRLLFYAILLGLLAAGGASLYLRQAEAQANPTQPVVVTKANIPSRAVITEDMLMIKKLPRGMVHPESSPTMDPFIGKSAKQSISAGEQLLTSKLFRTRAESGLAYVLPEGYRAVAMNANETIAAGGLVSPGDRVDVLGTCVVSVKDQTGKEQSNSIAKNVFSLQNIEVLAVAQSFEGSEAASPLSVVQARNSGTALAAPAGPTTKPTAKTITLALQPEDAQTLVLIEQHPACDVRLALRASGDDRSVGNGTLDFDPITSMRPRPVP